MQAPAAIHRAVEECGLVLLSDWPVWLLGLGLAAAAAALVLSWRGYRRTPSLGRRLTLFGLRTGAIATAVFIFLQPGQECRSVTRRQTAVVIALDTSRSMSVADGPNNRRRLDAARGAVERLLRRLGERAAEHRVEVYRFARTARPVASQELASLRADGDVTRTQESLEAVLSRRPHDDLAALVIVSDGADNGSLGQRWEASRKKSSFSPTFFRKLGVPVHAVVSGEREGLRDVAIAGVRYDPLVFVHNAFAIDVELAVQGFARLTLPVTLRRNEQVVTTEIVKVVPGRSRYRLTFKLQPERVGKFLYSITVPEQDREATVENNRRDLAVKVIRDKIRVLQVAGRPSWDERFMRRLLKRNPNVDLISFFILRTPTDLALVPPSELSLIPFPTRELFTDSINTFDLVIFQNFDYRPYQMRRYLPYVARYVLEHGGAFAMVGGEQSFGSGGYAGTPVEEILPVRVPPAAEKGILDPGAFRPELTPEGRRHPILRLAPSRRANDAAWKALPPLRGVNLAGGLRPEATALLVHPRLRVGGQPLPVLAVLEPGKGRSLSLTTDSSWRWGFSAKQGSGVRFPYQRFWNNAIRWLIRDPELELVRIVPEKETFGIRERVAVEVRVQGRDYVPAVGAAVTLRAHPLRRSAGKPLVRQGETGEGGRWRVDLGRLPAGPYLLRARARLRGDDLGEAEEAVLVAVPALELEDPRANPALLKRLADATGGQRWFAAEEPPDSLRLRPPQVIRVDRKRATGYWDSGFVLLVAVLFLGAEWLLRRRWGFL